MSYSYRNADHILHSGLFIFTAYTQHLFYFSTSAYLVAPVQNASRLLFPS